MLSYIVNTDKGKPISAGYKIFLKDGVVISDESCRQAITVRQFPVSLRIDL